MTALSKNIIIYPVKVLWQKGVCYHHMDDVDDVFESVDSNNAIKKI